MLPQLSYIVAQAGVDSRPPPMLPRLTKPFQVIGMDSKANGTITTPSSTSGTNLDPSIFTSPASYYVRPGSSPSAPPPLLPIPSNTSSTLTSPSTDVVSTSSATTTSTSYAYPPPTNIVTTTTTTTAAAATAAAATAATAAAQMTSSTKLSSSSSVVGAETGRVPASSSRLAAATPQWQSLQKSPPPPPPPTTTTTTHTMATNPSLYHGFLPPPPPLPSSHLYNHQSHPQQQQQHHHHYQPPTSSSSSSSTGYSQQQLYSPSSNLVYPTYQSNDQWTHRVTAPFVEPSKSSSSPPPPLSVNGNHHHHHHHTYTPPSSTGTTAYVPPTYTNSTYQPMDHSYSALKTSTADPYQPHLLQRKQQNHPNKYHEDHHHQQQQQQQQRRRPSRGFTVPDNTIALNEQDNNDNDDEGDIEDEENDDDTTAINFHATSYTTSHRVEHMNKWNQLLTRMDHEFWEQSQEIYQEKLMSLQQELKSLQNDTHVTFRESLSDLKRQRDAMIADAEYFLNYEMEGTEQLYQEDIAGIEDDYNNERKHLHNAIMAAIEDRRRLIKEEKDYGLTTKDLFDEAYSRVTNKRTLRKRPAETSRHDSRKRQGRHAASHQLENSAASRKEEDELDDELSLMKMSSQAL